MVALPCYATSGRTSCQPAPTDNRLKNTESVIARKSVHHVFWSTFPARDSDALKQPTSDARAVATWSSGARAGQWSWPTWLGRSCPTVHGWIRCTREARPLLESAAGAEHPRPLSVTLLMASITERWPQGQRGDSKFGVIQCCVSQ